MLNPDTINQTDQVIEIAGRQGLNVTCVIHYLKEDGFVIGVLGRLHGVFIACI